MKRYWAAILLVCVLAGLILYRAIPDSSVESSATDIGEIQLQSSALASQKESTNVGSSIQESQTSTAFASEVLTPKPVETPTPSTTDTQPYIPEPPTVPSATQPATTKPALATTSPTVHTHNYTKEYVSPFGGGQAYYVYTCSCGDKYQENYSCGVEGHICMNETYHKSLVKFINDGCTHCGSSECPCLLAMNDYGFTWPDYSQCPNYDEQKDPALYCQECGLIGAGPAKSGQECCRRTNKDVTCSWCQNPITAGKCHRCTKP